MRPNRPLFGEFQRRMKREELILRYASSDIGIKNETLVLSLPS
jgi:hypothetical protein